MLEKIEAPVKSILLVFYESFWFSLLIAFICMFFFFSVKEHGIKGSFIRWGNAFKASKRFRRVFLFSFFTAVILIQTLFNRELQVNPLKDVMGEWWFYYDKKGNLITRPIENILMMIPFILLLFMALGDKIMEKITFLNIVWRAVAISFCFSLSIETIQLVGRLGTFQLSDLAYNTLGGLIGGLIYYTGYKIKHKRD